MLGLGVETRLLPANLKTVKGEALSQLVKVYD